MSLRCCGRTIVAGVAGCEGKYVTDYLVEHGPGKLKWLRALHRVLYPTPVCIHAGPALPPVGPCVFKEMEVMDMAVAPCYQPSHAHPGQPVSDCPVPHSAALKYCGFSCQDLSNLSSNRKDAPITFIEGKGKSGKTFAEFMSHLEVHGGQVVVCENLDEISKVTSEVRAHIMREFAQRGWVANVDTVKSKETGAITSRVRAYLIAMRPASFNIDKEAAHTLVNKMFATRKKLKSEPFPPDEVILRATDSYLSSALYAYEEPAQSKKSDWKENFERVLSVTSATWSDLAASIKADTTGTYKRLCEREQVTLALLKLKHPDAFAFEVSQSPGRESAYFGDVFGTITTHSKFVLNDVKGRELRLLTGKDLLLLQGMPKNTIDAALTYEDISDAGLRHLAGDAFEAGAFSSVPLSKRWW